MPPPWIVPGSMQYPQHPVKLRIKIGEKKKRVEISMRITETVRDLSEKLIQLKITSIQPERQLIEYEGTTLQLDDVLGKIWGSKGMGLETGYRYSLSRWP